MKKARRYHSRNKNGYDFYLSKENSKCICRKILRMEEISIEKEKVILLIYIFSLDFHKQDRLEDRLNELNRLHRFIYSGVDDAVMISTKTQSILDKKMHSSKYSRFGKLTIALFYKSRVLTTL